MHRIFRRSLPLVMLACVGWPLAASAAPHIRTGFCAGVGFGWESVAWSDGDDRQPSEGSGVMNARAGWAVEPDMVVGLEFWGWAKGYETLVGDFTVPVDVKLAATTACVTFFPDAGGFFVRLGAGLAYGHVSIEPPSSVTEVATSKETRTGFAANIAPGYEWRVAKRMALGFQGDIVYLGLGDPLNNAFGYGVNAQFNWYW
ncbi:MAG TPA: outer membrane beta-barrel protein [Candidatus Krumholzibacteria bacterium]|nr:outer membrane beta-barrel protein [Candidatus Krumholzibacteria bacterium]